MILMFAFERIFYLDLSRINTLIIFIIRNVKYFAVANILSGSRTKSDKTTVCI